MIAFSDKERDKFYDFLELPEFGRGIYGYNGGENSSDNDIPRMTLEQYDALDEKPELWIRTDDPPKDYLTSDQVSCIKGSSLDDFTVTDSFSNIREELNNLKENMNRKLNITMLHGCRNCGAKIDVDINKPVFCCKYCGTSYVIGTVQQNSTY